MKSAKKKQENNPKIETDNFISENQLAELIALGYESLRQRNAIKSSDNGNFTESKTKTSGDDTHMGVTALYFTAENIAKIVSIDIKDGTTAIDGKTYIVDAHYPIMLQKTGLMSKITGKHNPMFILKHDKIYPDKQLNAIRPDFEIKNKKGEIIEQEINPEILNKTMSMKILGNMLKVKKDTSTITMIALGLIAGFVLMYLMIEFNLIHVG